MLQCSGEITINGIKVGSSSYIVKVGLDGSVTVEGEYFSYEEFQRLRLTTKIHGDPIEESFHQKTMYKKYYAKLAKFASKVRRLKLTVK